MYSSHSAGVSRPAAVKTWGWRIVASGMAEINVGPAMPADPSFFLPLVQSVDERREVVGQSVETKPVGRPHDAHGRRNGLKVENEGTGVAGVHRKGDYCCRRRRPPVRIGVPNLRDRLPEVARLSP